MPRPPAEPPELLLASSPPAEPAASPPAAGAGPAVHVLLVEANPFDAELVEHSLRRAGLAPRIDRVAEAGAFRAALSGMPDVILADVELPTFGALEALAILRSLGASIPLIAVAGSSREEATVAALRAGAVDYLFKSQLARLPLAVRTAVERERLLRRLDDKGRNLARLSLELVTAQENERKRLARELHDELGQRLTILNLLLYRLQPGPGTPARDDWDLAERELAALAAQVRGMSVALRPPALDYSGLEAALGQLVERIAGTAGLRRVFEYAGLPPKLPAPLDMTVYRLVQEGLTNIVRHARASEVVVEVNGGADGAEVEVIVRDNGVGFAPAGGGREPGGPLSSGLRGMRERVELLGGQFELHSAPGTGTRICATFPLRSEESKP